MEKVFVNKFAGVLDTLYAAIRYLVVIAGAVPLLLQLLGAHDLIAIVHYFQSADGQTLVAAVGALVALAAGLFKSFRRGSTLAKLAADPSVKGVGLK